MTPSILTLQALPKNLEDATAFISGRFQSFPEPGRLEGLLLAVEEAFINICNYAHPQGGGVVEISCFFLDDDFVVEMSDDGPAFDPLALPDPDILLDIDERDIGGLGVHFIRHFTDKAEYSRKNNRNILSLTLYGKRGKEGRPAP